ncbi:MAG: hypothetical protein KC613_08215 [Myxococcales bacterium]|nr:hypothetical protein [Myxococcales bacterium]
MTVLLGPHQSYLLAQQRSWPRALTVEVEALLRPYGPYLAGVRRSDPVEGLLESLSTATDSIESGAVSVLGRYLQFTHPSELTSSISILVNRIRESEGEDVGELCSQLATAIGWSMPTLYSEVLDRLPPGTGVQCLDSLRSRARGVLVNREMSFHGASFRLLPLFRLIELRAGMVK